MAYTIETYQSRLEERLPESNIQLIEFNGVKFPCTFVCNTCGTEHTYRQADKIMDRARRKLKNACGTCEDTAQLKPRLKVINKVDSLLKKKTTIIRTEEIRRVNDKITWHCSKCDHDFERSAKDFLANSKCPWCEGMFPKYTIEIIKEKARMLYGEEYEVLDEHYDSKISNRVLVRHDCGFIFDVRADLFLAGQGCPRCRASRGERKVRSYLDSYNFYYQEQYPIIVNGITLYCDFYLVEGNKTFVIEYNGKQHYEEVPFFHRENGLAIQQENDRLKKQYCIDQGWEFIVIPHFDESLLESDLLAQRLGRQAPEQ